MRPFSFLSLSLPAAALLAAGPLAAQGPIHQVLGDSAYDGLGRAVSWVGDINSDGFDEFIAGAPLDDNNGQDSGMARLFDGFAGTAILSIDGDNQADEFGGVVAGVGDVNNDGVPDFAIGAMLDDNLAVGGGMARVYSGSGFFVIHQWDGPTATDMLGCDIAGAGDINGDGYDDVIVAARQRYDSSSANPGYVKVYSGATGAVIWTLTGGTSANLQFGYSVAGGRDVDGDGVNDIAVGVYGDDTVALNSGAVWVFSGATGLAITTVYGDTAQDHLGADVALIGDVTGDGRADLLATATGDDTNGTSSGMARVYRGDTGATVATLRGTMTNGEFGYSCGDFADITGDGVEEFLVGAWRDDSGANLDVGIVYVFDGATFAIHQQAEGQVSDRMGFACSRAGDVNNDGIEDFIGGASQYGSSGGNGQGYAIVYDVTQVPPPPPLRWPFIPNSFVAVGAGYADNFDSYLGVLPAHMAVNELLTALRVIDPDAWCNIGQNGPTAGGGGVTPYSGAYMLEMGGNPNGMSTNHDVSNALVIGLNGAGNPGLVLDFQAFNLGEEGSLDDGVWVSDDGVVWERMFTSWLGVSTTAWDAQTGIDLSTSSVSTAGDFYLALAQSDNFELGLNDGICIDDVSVHSSGPQPPTLAVYNLIAGMLATIEVTNNNPGDRCLVGYSKFGGGPINTPFGQVYLTPPYVALPPMTANALGVAQLVAPVPPIAAGANVWLHGLNQTQGILTNPIATTIL
ncbi:MAG: FG-GAP repeat protein [Planctomycetes bacterium]|nr:FG-GAP repeat protein [Planctomycetota bacterium]